MHIMSVEKKLSVWSIFDWHLRITWHLFLETAADIGDKIILHRDKIWYTKKLLDFSS